MRNRTILLATLAPSGFVTSFGAHVVATNLPTYAETVGVGAFTIGMLIAVYDFAELFAKPAAGGVADRRGMKAVPLLGLVVFIVRSLLFPNVKSQALAAGAVRPRAWRRRAVHGVDQSRRPLFRDRPWSRARCVQCDQGQRVCDRASGGWASRESLWVRDDFVVSASIGLVALIVSLFGQAVATRHGFDPKSSERQALNHPEGARARTLSSAVTVAWCSPKSAYQPHGRSEVIAARGISRHGPAKAGHYRHQLIILNCSASAMWSAPIRSSPARSAIVRATLRTRS